MPKKTLYLLAVLFVGISLIFSVVFLTLKKNVGHADLVTGAVEVQPPLNVRGEPLWVVATSKGTDVLSWDASPDAVSYNIYKNYEKIGSGILATTWQIPTALYNKASFTVTTVSSTGQESIPSNIFLYIDAFSPTDPSRRQTNVVPSPTQLSVTPEWNAGKPRMKVAWLDGCCDQPYNIYRDGQMIAQGMRVFTYYDTAVAPGESHTYYATTYDTFTTATAESAPSNSVAATVLLSAPATLAQKVNVTGVQRNDDSVTVYFDTVPGASDYRIYKTTSPHNMKYSGRRDYRATDLPCGKILADCGLTPIPYSIELNNVDIVNGNDVVVEAVDKMGPFQTMDGVNDLAPGSMLADGMHMSTNGQGDPSDLPNILARSDIFHITAKSRALTGAQVFFDNFRNEQPLVDLPNNQVDPAIQAFHGYPDHPELDSNNFLYHGVSETDNNKWALRTYDADRKNTKLFFMNNHFMDTEYDGPEVEHNNNSSVVMMPKATADISGGKVLHWTEEIDAHADSRRFFDTIITQAGQSLIRADPSKIVLSPGQGLTAEGHDLVWSINSDFNSVLQFNGKDVNGKALQSDVVNTAYAPNTIGSGGERLSSHEIPLLNGSDQELDKRHIFDMYLSQTHITVFENGQEAFNADLNQPLPFTNIQLYAAHELYHTYNDRNEQIMQGYSAGYNVYGGYTTYDHNLGDYWIDHRPYSDERHWDNMGFEVVDSMSQAHGTVLAMEAPQFIVNPTPTPTPTISATVCATVTLANRPAGSNQHSSVQVQARNGGGTVLASVTATSTNNGNLQVVDPTFISAVSGVGSYTLWIKPAGYFSQQLTGLANLTASCQVFPQAFSPGDFSNTNTVTLGDLVTAIRAFNGSPTPITQYVYLTQPGISDLVTLIREFNNHVTGPS